MDKSRCPATTQLGAAHLGNLKVLLVMVKCSVVYSRDCRAAFTSHREVIHCRPPRTTLAHLQLIDNTELPGDGRFSHVHNVSSDYVLRVLSCSQSTGTIAIFPWHLALHQ